MGRPRRPETDRQLSALEEAFLLLLRGQARYGFGLLTALHEVCGRSLSVGALYPTLHALERKGLIRSWWGSDRAEERGHARRRYYTATPAGEDALGTMEDQRRRLAQWPHVCQGAHV